MPRPIWSGAISFGLVTIPIRVLPATENHNISFHQYHQTDGGRIRYEKVCELDGRTLQQSEIGRGYEVSTDTIIEVTDADLDSMPLPTAKAIEIVAFVPAESIDPIRIGDSYYLAAEGVAAKPYKLLRMALERNSKVAIAKFAWHNRERLGLLRVKDDAIVLHSMRWPDEIRSSESLAPRAVEVDAEEVEAAVELMDAMSIDDIGGFRDHYREALEDVIRAKSQGLRPEGAEPQPTAAPVVDLMAALRESVESARQSRGEGDGASVHDMAGHVERKAKAPTKKTAKKAAAKKASRKSPA